MAKTHKDSLFRSILNHEKPLLQIYNALRRTHYSAEQAEIVINTLGETLWTAKKNDISFSVNNELIVMLEHQSTINENMPLRFLQIISRLFENSIENKKDLYKQKMIKLQRPIFVVFYIGKAPFPPFKIMRLSDAFKDVAGFEGITLELEAWVFNINDGMNEELVNACEELKGYVYFVSRVRFYEGQGCDTLSSIRKAIEDSKKEDVLRDFWENMTTEDIIMLETEWDLNTALEVCREESFEEGREEGEEKVRMEIINLINKGYSLEDLMKEFSTQ